MSVFGADEDDGALWVRLTPERVAVLCLEDCAYQLERSGRDIDRLALAAKAAHLALQAALTAALAGSANVGAHPLKLRVKYLQYLEDSRSGPAEAPASDRVMGFDDLLAAATDHPLPWTQAPLAVNNAELVLLKRLTVLRHAVEHPKQSHHSIEPAYVAETVPVASRLTAELLASVFHHLEPGELEAVEALAVRIVELSSVHLSGAESAG